MRVFDISCVIDWYDAQSFDIATRSLLAAWHGRFVVNMRNRGWKNLGSYKKSVLGF